MHLRTRCALAALLLLWGGATRAQEQEPDVAAIRAAATGLVPARHRVAGRHAGAREAAPIGLHRRPALFRAMEAGGADAV
jgi:hypothetical protein